MIKKVQRLLDRFVSEHIDGPFRVSRAIFFGRSFTLLDTPRGFMLLRGESKPIELDGIIVGKYNIYVYDALYGLLLLNKITQQEYDNTLRWIRTKQEREDRNRSIALLMKESRTLGYECMPRPRS